ncbi:lipopolysaccharide-induced tumor necrosis factor-alpha factor homolog-like [Clupea harengus]|uniref:Lipopolysaccharide-induced tumor necrosis factor-alpha factor homolog-like n=1 Tax=Clupea harengus TaxID=7950 RepID=A0A6P8FDM6_CLUHA|nr:lipopolysaccharide-induced tumor necrosis factor-alpha factor homolog-like [Clupea harengus]
MSTGGRGEPPPYIIPVEGPEGDDGVKVYHLHTPFTPPSSTIERFQSPGDDPYASVTQAENVSSTQAGAPPQEGVKRFVSEDRELGSSPGMITCPSCQQQVLTEVTYKVGSYAWIMCFVFILCGLVLCCCLIPLFHKHFKDAYHSCPRCQRVLHVEKKKCCP